MYASYHLKQFHSTLDYERINSSCIFSNIVFAMPRCISPDKKFQESTPKSVSISSYDQNVEKEKVQLLFFLCSMTVNLLDFSGSLLVRLYFTFRFAKAINYLYYFVYLFFNWMENY